MTDPVPSCTPDAGDTAWISLSTILVLSMMPALGLFEAGLLRARNTVSILTQIIVGMSLSSVLWFFFGFSFVYGDSLKGIIGNPATFAGFRNVDTDCWDDIEIPKVSFAMFQMMFAAITPLLMTGAYAERLLWRPFVIFTFLYEIFVYYPVAHWIWGDGWMARMGVQDFAGGIVIHTTAGAASIVSALVLGKRAGFYENDGEFPPSSLPIACIGGAMLWMGWFGFNAGSALTAGAESAIVITNTQLASAICSLIWVSLAWYRRRPNVVDALNGAIAGLAGITPAAGYITPWAAFVTGIFLGFGSYFSLELLRFRWHIDDALDVSSVHGMTGVIGSLMIGFAADVTVGGKSNGLINGDRGHLLGVQTMAVVITAAYTGVVTFLIFFFLKQIGPISVQMDADHIGLDALEHDVEAYRHHTASSSATTDVSMLVPPGGPAAPPKHKHHRLHGWKHIQSSLTSVNNDAQLRTRLMDG